MTTKKNKPQMRDLDTVPYFEVEDAVDKIERRREKNRRVEEELERRTEMQHPTLTKWKPYLMAISIIVGMTVFFLALWLIPQVNNSSQFVLMRLMK